MTASSFSPVRFTRVVYGVEWTLKIDPFTGNTTASRGSFTRDGHTYAGFEHTIAAGAQASRGTLMRNAVVLINRLRSISNLTASSLRPASLVGRQGSHNPNSCREARRVMAMVSRKAA